EKGSLFFPVSECVCEIIKQARKDDAQIIIGIDAALAWPVKFVKLVNSAPAADHLPNFKPDGAINNPYLYRETERFIKKNVMTVAKDKSPLTAPGDKFGNNSSKGQVLVAWFKGECGKELYRPPFDEWNQDKAKKAKYTLLEVYPAASMKSEEFRKLNWPNNETSNETSMENLGKGDIADAKRAAMTCVCYAATVGKINGDYPTVHAPSDADSKKYNLETIKKEGWIFSPKVKKGSK
ncbi:MAG: hypothetical protein HQK85_04975, partial [Nitrospinae bacterium]|nr:hypothetical protein [Nitrospinota bacterium]